MRSRKPAARRGEVQCWHGGPRNAVHEYVGASNAAACLAVQRAELGLVGHTHVAAAWRQTPRGARAVKIRVGEPLDLAGGKWLLNPARSARPRRRGSAGGTRSTLQAADGAYWLLLDLERRTATWHRAPYDPAPARLERGRSVSTMPRYPANLLRRPGVVPRPTATLKGRPHAPASTSSTPLRPLPSPPRCSPQQDRRAPGPGPSSLIGYNGHAGLGANAYQHDASDLEFLFFSVTNTIEVLARM